MKSSRLALALWLLAATAFAADVKLPATPAGKRISALLAAFNTGDRERLNNFVIFNYAATSLKSRPAESRVPTYLDLYDETRGLQLRRIEQSKDSDIVILAQAKLSQEWYRITCPVEPRKPHGILGVTFRLVPRPADLAPHGTLSDEQIVAEARGYAEKLSGAGLFGGVVTVAKSGRPLLQASYPWRKRSGDVETYKLDDRFGLASINKIFTAVAIAQLAEQGKLAFSDAIANYLPEYPPDRHTTVEQLLTHTAGLEPFLDLESFDALRRAGVRTQADRVKFLGSRPLVSKPGEKFGYSNADYWLLEAIVERVSGDPYNQYLAAHLFQPLTMHASGGDSTAADLVKFAEALRSGTLLGPTMAARLITPRVQTDDPDVQYGYGLQVEVVNGTRVVGHPGGSETVSAQLDMYPDLGYTVVVLSKRPGGTAQHIANRLRELITQK